MVDALSLRLIVSASLAMDSGLATNKRPTERESQHTCELLAILKTLQILDRSSACVYLFLFSTSRASYGHLFQLRMQSLSYLKDDLSFSSETILFYFSPLIFLLLPSLIPAFDIISSLQNMFL
uniref:Uncharacterized protein n=1 Tax=Physcomitrium patens TaxID=3218 RepID=A0A2K1KBQ8_PHYPA|nr:hypothetical protein PHYPA_010396 [Physcomitrium patens]